MVIKVISVLAQSGGGGGFARKAFSGPTACRYKAQSAYLVND